MSTTLEDLLAGLPSERKSAIDARAAELVAEEMTLRDLRKARQLTQERLAELLRIGQESVSRLEQRSDLLLSTLQGYVVAMGGTLELVVRFPDRPAVILAGLTGLAKRGGPSNSKDGAARKDGVRARAARARNQGVVS